MDRIATRLNSASCRGTELKAIETIQFNPWPAKRSNADSSHGYQWPICSLMTHDSCSSKETAFKQEMWTYKITRRPCQRVYIGCLHIMVCRVTMIASRKCSCLAIRKRAGSVVTVEPLNRRGFFTKDFMFGPNPQFNNRTYFWPAKIIRQDVNNVRLRYCSNHLVWFGKTLVVVQLLVFFVAGAVPFSQINTLILVPSTHEDRRGSSTNKDLIYLIYFKELS